MTLNKNGIDFKEGDLVTLIYSRHVIQGELHIEAEKIIVYHNDPSFGFTNDLSNKYYYHISFNLEQNDYILLHRVNLESNRLQIQLDENINAYIKDIESKNKWAHLLFSIKNEFTDNYDTITTGDELNMIILHSSDRNKRLPIKMSRLFRRMLDSINVIICENDKNIPLVIKDDEIEQLHNLWCSYNPKFIKYEIVSGVDILKGYTYNNYIPKIGGTLHNSCMSDKYSFLKLYTENPDKISLIIFYNALDQIIGRSIIWKSDDGNTYYDRIYYSSDWMQNSFSKICKEELNLLPIHGKEVEAKVTLNNIDFRLFPYLDTFYKFSYKTKTLYSCYSDVLSKYSLRNTNGHIYEENNITEDQTI